MFGSQAGGRTTGFSDVDAILVISDEIAGDATEMPSLRRCVLAAQRAVIRYQPMQHHGFEIVTPTLLRDASGALALPAVALAETRSLRGHADRCVRPQRPSATCRRRPTSSHTFGSRLRHVAKTSVGVAPIDRDVRVAPDAVRSKSPQGRSEVQFVRRGSRRLRGLVVALRRPQRDSNRVAEDAAAASRDDRIAREKSLGVGRSLASPSRVGASTDLFVSHAAASRRPPCLGPRNGGLSVHLDRCRLTTFPMRKQASISETERAYQEVLPVGGGAPAVRLGPSAAVPKVEVK